MAKVVIGSALARWLKPAPAAEGEVAVEVPGASVGDVLEGLFAAHPGLRPYALDEHGALRRHLALFINGDALQPKNEFSRPVPPDAEIYLMQALSGG